MPQPVKRLPPLSIRLSENERAALERRAGGAGLSTYVKSVLFEGGPARPSSKNRRASADQVLLAQILGHLGAGGLALSMRRLAEAADTGSLYVDDLVSARLHHACEDIEQMHTALMRALGKQPRAKRLLLVENFRRAASPQEERP